MSDTSSFQKWSKILGRFSLFLRKFPSIVEGLKILRKKDKTEALSIGTYLETNANKYPDNKALLYEDQVYTHQEFNAWVNRYANFFLEQGFQKGDTIAVLLENRPEILVCVGAMAKIGVIASLINTNQREDALIHSFKLCKPKGFVIGEELMDSFDKIKGKLSLSTETLYYLADNSDTPPPKDFNDLKTVTEAVSVQNPSTTGQIMMQDACFYVYTSGTTGLPKASIMTHFRWIKASAAFGMFSLNMKPDDIIYVPLPFYHNNALTVSWSSASARGAGLALRRKFSASHFWEDTRKFNATSFCYIGELCRYLMNQPPSPDDRNNPVIKVVGNGLRTEIWMDFKERFGISEVYEFFAASEGNSGFFNFLNLDCTVGLSPLPYLLAKYDTEAGKLVKDENGFCVKAKKGDVGLMLGKVTPKTPFDGYTNKEANEEKLLRNVLEKDDVWFNFGDLLRDQGFRHAQFVDRLGDTFRWKGENVSTTEVEGVINQFEQVDECTVYGVTIPGADGKAGMVSIVPNVSQRNFDFQGLTQHLRSKLPDYAIPIFLRIQPQLTITGTFKHRKVELKAQGYDAKQGEGKVHVLFPKEEKYASLTEKRYQDIIAEKYSF